MDELRQHPFMTDDRLVEKTYLLAKGIVKVHGFEKEKVMHLAMKLAREWYRNNGTYTIDQFCIPCAARAFLKTTELRIYTTDIMLN